MTNSLNSTPSGRFIRTAYVASKNESYALIRYPNRYVVETMDTTTGKRREVYSITFNPHAPAARAVSLDAAKREFETAHRS